MDASGAVIVGATVSVSGGETPLETTSDAQGHYHFDQVAPGAYTLVAFRDGFSPQTKEIAVAAGQPVVLDLRLEVAGFREEVTVGFTGATALSAMKIETPIADIPLSVQSYTGSFMKAIETTNVADLYNYTTGVARSGNTAVDFVIRGVRASNTGNILYNGLPGLAARFNSPSTVNVERIEVMKGPTSVLYGQAQPGGVINIVTKKPQAERQNLIDFRGGTFMAAGVGAGDRNKGHLSMDSTGPIDTARKWLYRFVASYDDANDFRDYVNNRDTYLVPALSWMGWQGAVLNLEFEYRRTRTSNDSGLVAPNNDLSLVAPRHVRYQEPADYLNENGKTLTSNLRKTFGNDWTWTATWRSVWHDDDTKTYENAGTSGTTIVTRRDRRQLNQRRYHYLDTTFAKMIAIGGMQHHFLTGYNGGYELTDFDRVQFATGPSLNVNIYNPVYGAPNLPSKPDTHRYTPALTNGVYLNDQITLTERWKALIGVRYERRDSQEQELRINPYTKKKSSDAVLPLAGLVFEPDKIFSIYGSYATSYTPPPPGAVDAFGNNPFKPERARQYETGVKAALPSGRGEASVSYFDIEKNDVLITLVAQAINDQIGQERSQGVETTYTERLLPNWNVILGYSHTNSRVTKDSDVTRIGSRITNAPRNAANLWTRYDLKSGPLGGLGVGFGLVYSGDRAGTIAQSTSKLPILILPSYTRADMGVYWVRQRYEITAFVTNLADTIYYESNLGTGTTALNIRPGAPRSATVSLRVKF